MFFHFLPSNNNAADIQSSDLAQFSELDTAWPLRQDKLNDRRRVFGHKTDSSSLTRSFHLKGAS